MISVVTRRRALAGLFAIGIAGASACTGPTTHGQASTALTGALEDAASAVETCDLTLGLLVQRRLTAAVADTALLDQIRVLEESTSALTTLVPPAELGQARSSALSALGAASAAVVEARAWVSGELGAADGPGAAAEVSEALADAGEQIDDALAQVGP
ncbi:hypothetical protein [Pseudactinotalea sp.]|uniref:hypothetical protein n=1 Tax=Pseudactinotalea sp. TaxID=1926260 RepID=UPI003B3AD2DF